MQTFLKGRRVGYWLSEMKMKKLNFGVFVDMCRKRGIEMIELDLGRPLEEQGPLDIIIHKLTNLLLDAENGDTHALLLVQRVQEYIEAHPETVVLDPLPAIRTLLDRWRSYQLIRKIEGCMKDDRISSPPFTVLNGEYGPDTMSQIEKHGISFPFVCKTRVAHGTDSHEMALIFSEEDLKEIKPPCVVQSFINHNAVLYKVFVVGESYTVVERPSLRNFPSGPADRDAIFFNSHNVSKPECSSALTSRDNPEGVSRLPCDDVIRSLSKALRQALGVSLFGIDIIISNQTGQHAVIDINAFPGYEGVPEFFNDLLSLISGILQNQALDTTPSGQHRDSELNSAPPGQEWASELNSAPFGQHRNREPDITPSGQGMDSELNSAFSGQHRENDLDIVPSAQTKSDKLDSTLSGQNRGTMPGLAPVNGERDCCGILGKDLTLMAEAEVARTTQGSRRGCNTAVSPNFQSHCRSPIAAQASSQ